jgi:hypothetical protein
MYRKAALLVGFLAALLWRRAPLAGQDQPITPLGIALESYPYPGPIHFLNFDMQGQLGDAQSRSEKNSPSKLKPSLHSWRKNISTARQLTG